MGGRLGRILPGGKRRLGGYIAPAQWPFLFSGNLRGYLKSPV